MTSTASRNRKLVCAAVAAAAIASLVVAVGLTRADDAPKAPAPSGAAAADAPLGRPRLDEWARATRETADAASALWAALTPEQQKQAGFEFEDAERKNFHFIPRERKGLPLGRMTPTQRHLAHALLATGLSQRGFVQAVSIMSLEEILLHIEQGKGPKRDPELYFFSIFGTPGPTGTWGWRVEGHHLTLNFTMVNGRGIAGTPAFLGSNPGEVREGPRKGLRVLADVEDAGFKLIGMLDEAQRKTAVVDAKAPEEIKSGALPRAEPLEPKGIAVAELKPEQSAALRELVRLYACRLRDEVARQDMARIEEAGWERVHFAWAGATEPGGGPHYYRIQGPTFLIEFDNIQNNANHPHTAWRDLAGDFGEDLLRRHYDKEHK